MSFLIIFFLFIIWRIIDFLILYFVPKFIPYLGFFPYKEILPLYHLPEWITKLANFDGTHYLLISQQGYMTYEQAYFPLYPLLIRLLTPVFFNNSFIAAFLISNISFLLGLWIFSKYLFEIKFSKKHIFWIIVLLLAFPSSFFFGAIYTEGLFFFLFTASLYFLKKGNYVLSGIFAFFTSLTRLIGIFLIIPFFFHFISKIIHNKKHKPLLSIFTSPFSILIAASLFGLFIYCLYLWKTIGDPFFFFSSQPIFGAHRSTSLILLPQVYWRYLKIFLTANHDFRFYVSMFEVIMFTTVFVVLIFDLLKNIKFIGPWKLVIGNSNRLALNLFSLANLLVPTLTGTFSSIPRYVLFSLSFFILLGNINNKLIKIIISIIFILCHMVLLGFFGQGYFIG